MTTTAGAAGPLRPAPREPLEARDPGAPLTATGSAQHFFDTLGTFATVHAIKLYRLQLDVPSRVPVLPCLDHEAMLHEGVPPHAAGYIQDAGGDLHELVYIPDKRRIDMDIVSTMGEHDEDSRGRLVAMLRERFPQHAVRVVHPSRVRGEYRVANACRAQVALRDVLMGPDLDRTKAAVDRLQTISALMEKESRVASWGARTVMTPLIALAGFLSYQLLGAFAPQLGSDAATWLQYVVVTLVSAGFLYYGLKAVQLTEMANRVWKRSAEYSLILNERRRLGRK